MSERIRRYIPSFKRRKLDGVYEPRSIFWDANGEQDGEREEEKRYQEGEVAPKEEVRGGAIALTRLPARQSSTQKDGVLGLQRPRRRRLLKRQDGEPTPDSGDDTNNPVTDIVNGVVNGRPILPSADVTVTVSIGLSVQITTISSSGTTFVTTMNSSWFTLDANGNISRPPISTPAPTPVLAPTTPTPTSTPNSSSTPSSSSDDSTSPIQSDSTQPTTTTTTPLITNIPPSPFPNLPTPTPDTTSITTSSTPSMEQAPVAISSASLTSSSSSSMVYSLAPNMTEYSLTRVRTTLHKTTSHLVTTTKSFGSNSSSLSSTRISTIFTPVTTIFPAESEPSTPLESPTSSFDSTNGTDTSSGNGNSGDSMSEKLPPILGGVFGGLAAVGLVLWAILFLLRKRRRNTRGVGILSSTAAGSVGGGGTGNHHRRGISQETAAGSVGEMSQPRSSLVPSFLGAGAGLFGGRSSADTASAPSAERGFVKISGRKLPSMYGDDMVPTSLTVASARASASEPGSRNVSGGTHQAGSVYQDDDGIMQAPAGSPFAPSTARNAMRTGSPALVSRIAEDEPEAKPSKEFHPVPPPQIQDPAEGSSRFPTPPPGAVRRMHSLIGTDAVGRSLASQDGSKTSRFTEDV
ncbi:hypothetical protein ABW20_dc0109995 [Dactylellina cionopaga]|nr:hypothetical protein ABW20_dc0109995 [Dactylellina cionopaga]